jgi:hypothetical protein
LDVLHDHTGAENAIAAADLAERVTTFLGEPVSEREIRQAIHDLRHVEKPVCSGATGFFWPACLQDVLACVDLQFRGEARSMLKTARIMRQAGNRLFGGQGRLI